MPNPASHADNGLFVRVAVPSPLRRLFDYLPPADCAQPISPGMRIEVPFGRQTLIGVVIALTNNCAVAEDKLRPARRVIDAEPLLPPALINLLNWASRYYQHPPGEVWSTALPARIRQGEPLHDAIEVWRCAADLEQAQSALSRAPRQLALFLMLQDTGAMTAAEIRGEGFSSKQLQELYDKALVRMELQQQDHGQPLAATGSPAKNALPLHAQQQDALAHITQQLGEFNCYLLDGITGSGKTEVYMQAMTRVLAAGRQCLILVPEIGLTPQTIGRFTARFNVPVVALHSGLNDNERAQAWLRARAGSAGIIIGTRSAIFTPLLHPGLIIIDEEHDSSFKQQDGFRYSARDLAVMRGQQEKIPVILGSATPSLESLNNARSGRFQHLKLNARAGTSLPATMQVIDIASLDPQAAFSESALLQMRQQLSAGNQVLAFINRRGFAPLLQCLHCGWTAECDDCSAHMTLHTRPGCLRCHHCGQQTAVPRACPGCKSRELSTLGVGTQKLEAFLETQFPDYPVLRIDRDSTRSKTRLAALIEQVNAGEPCVLLGTQMLAKGHHFPNLTLVVVVDADGGLFSADFRGQENMAQTIVQVAGRAGRAERPGKVLIQSRHATHAVLQRLTTSSYGEFAEHLLCERRDAIMPPFAHLAVFRAEAESPNSGNKFLQALAARYVQQNTDSGKRVDCLGPMPSPMEKRAGRYRHQLLLKSDSRGALQAMLEALVQWIETRPAQGKLRWSLDVDPQELI